MVLELIWLYGALSIRKQLNVDRKRVRSVWCCGRSGVWVYVEQKISSKRSCHFPKTRVSRLLGVALWQLSVPTNATSHNPSPCVLSSVKMRFSQLQSVRTPEPNPILTTITVELRDAAPTHGVTYSYVSRVFSAKERLYQSNGGKARPRC